MNDECVYHPSFVFTTPIKRNHLTQHKHKVKVNYRKIKKTQKKRYKIKVEFC